MDSTKIIQKPILTKPITKVENKSKSPLKGVESLKNPRIERFKKKHAIKEF